MINSTMSVEIVSFTQKSNDNNGVLNCKGYINFNKYSKDGNGNETMPFQAKGSAAKELDEAGVGTSGVAIGYLDLQVVDTGRGYKQKICTLVIRNFIPTSSGVNPELVQPISEMSSTAVPVLVGAGNTNGRTAIADINNISF